MGYIQFYKIKVEEKMRGYSRYHVILKDPLMPGTRVRTLSGKSDIHFTPEYQKARRWGVTGTIECHHDSHGLCYEVKHDDDGSIGAYEPTEFEIIQLVLKTEEVKGIE